MSTGIELARAYITVRGDSSKLPQDLTGIRRMVMGALGGLGIGFSLAGLVREGQRAIAEYQKVQQAQARLQAVLSATGNVLGKSFEQVMQMVKGYEALSGFDGADITNAMASLLTYSNLTEQQMDKVMKTGMDITAMYGGPLRTNVEQVAKLMSKPWGGLGVLSQRGYYVSREQEELLKIAKKKNDLAGAQKIILDVLSGQEGAAEKMGGVNKEARLLRKTIGDLREELGKRLLPIQDMVLRAQVAWQRVINGVLGPLGDLIIGADRLNTAMGGYPMLLAGTAVGFFSVAGAAGALSVVLETKTAVQVMRYTGLARLADFFTRKWAQANLLLIASLNKMNINGAALIKWLTRSPIAIAGTLAVVAGLAYGISKLIFWLGSLPQVQAANARTANRLAEAWGRTKAALAGIASGFGKLFLEVYQGALLLNGINPEELPKNVGEAYADVLDRTSTFVLEMSKTFQVMSANWDITWDNIVRSLQMRILQMQVMVTRWMADLGEQIRKLGPLGSLSTGLTGGALAMLTPDLKFQIEEMEKKIKDIQTEIDKSIGNMKPPEGFDGQGSQGQDSGGKKAEDATAKEMKAGRYGFAEFGKTIQDSLLGKEDKVPALLEGVIGAVEGVEDAVREGDAEVGGPAPPAMPAPPAAVGGDVAADGHRSRRNDEIDDRRLNRSKYEERQAKAAEAARYKNKIEVTPEERSFPMQSRNRRALEAGRGYRTVRPDGDTPTRRGSGIPIAPDPMAVDNTLLGMAQGRVDDLNRRRENDKERAARTRDMYKPHEDKLKGQLADIRAGINPEEQAKLADEEAKKLMENENRNTDRLITAIENNVVSTGLAE